jgi:hypothetical protein
MGSVSYKEINEKILMIQDLLVELDVPESIWFKPLLKIEEACVNKMLDKGNKFLDN